jgi:hypothetical protein
LNKAFPTTNQPSLSEMLSMHFTRDRTNRKLYIDQSHGINDFLTKWEIPTKLPHQVRAPMDPSWNYGTEPAITDEEKVTECRSRCSSISYFAQCTRPDLAYSTSKLMGYMQCPNKNCFKALDRLCSYLRTTSKLGLVYTGTDDQKLEAYCDSSWNASYSDKGKSTSGYLFYYGKDLIDWSSKRQEVIALSPAEAEQNAAFHTAKTAVYFRELLNELGLKPNHPTILHEDNTACIAQSKNPVNHQRTRHVNLRYHYLRELVKSNKVKLH